jgi:hypothetical protein
VVIVAWVRAEERQHGVRLAIEAEIVIKSGEDGIAIECTTARLLKT